MLKKTFFQLMTVFVIPAILIGVAVRERDDRDFERESELQNLYDQMHDKAYTESLRNDEDFNNYDEQGPEFYSPDQLVGSEQPKGCPTCMQKALEEERRRFLNEEHLREYRQEAEFKRRVRSHDFDQ